MIHRDRYSFFDREELLESVRELHKQVFGHRPDGDMYNALEIKALESIISDFKGILIKRLISRN